MPDHRRDAELARGLADEAGRLLLDVREQGLTGRELAADGDARSHEHLLGRLQQERPGDAVLSEEGEDDAARLSSERVWIVDPLDGTREFAEAGRTDWAVHVALWQRDELVAGAVALPARGVTFGTDVPARRPTGLPAPIRLAVSRSRPPAFVGALAERIGAELVPMGSAGVKATAVLDDAADAYVHAGGQYEWDSAAPVAVCRSSGLWTSRLDGSALRYNRRDPLLPDLLVCRPEIAELLLTELRAYLPEVD
ncbi:3'(2'),5'-bisphosphate nucleotidase CysQ [Angustibacter luteus]|uniref:3'(2'),5'-bisphosphate nucleotidase CysQ n=1 Tax=Angustibacter luteus TaxID=658456 RepID=A0ABW1JIX6_9ACTN